MPIIKLTTLIHSKTTICFDLSRSIDLHEISTAQSHEKAVDGRTSGLIGLNEYVTWQATHFGIQQKLTSRITAFERPHHFRDEQVDGAFKYFIHDHYFEQQEDIVVMKDIFDFQSPFGCLGDIFNRLILTGYMKNLLLKRNEIIKAYAESNKWKALLIKNGFDNKN